MIPAPFDYHRPSSLNEAINLLKHHGAQAKVLSGGMSLLPTLKLRLGVCPHLVDINRIPGLDALEEEGGFLRIGALTRQATLERSELIRRKYPILADAVALIADPLVRNRGTVGGNVANGDPANDEPAIMIALGAALVARGPKGERTIPANKFYTDLYTTALARDEILVEIRIPVPPAKSGGAYQKLKRKTGDFAVAAAAVQLTWMPRARWRAASSR
jgi:carbon-monoxide dehydrogenase medium subunit